LELVKLGKKMVTKGVLLPKTIPQKKIDDFGGIR
jgi:hypothetical protein